MITGTVDESGVPTICIVIAGAEWKAIVDTGFNGDLELPYSLGSYVSPRFLGRGFSALAGGQTVEEDHYLVNFPIDGRTIRAVATFVNGDEILLGTGLLREYRLIINFPESHLTLNRE